MLITSTNNLEGHVILSYLDIVSGTAVLGAHFFKDLAASFTDILGGRSKSYENEINNAKRLALQDMTNQATRLKANAILSVKIDVETIGMSSGHMILVNAVGMSVICQKNDEFNKKCHMCAEMIKIEASVCKFCGEQFDSANDIKNMVEILKNNKADKENIMRHAKSAFLKHEQEIEEKRKEEFKTRVLCSDGKCIGVIGHDGKCKECGLPNA